MATTEAKEAANAIFFNYTQPVVSVFISDSVSQITHDTKQAFYTGFLFDSFQKNYESSLLKNFFELLNKKAESYGVLAKISEKSLNSMLNNIVDLISQLGVENLKLRPTYDESVLFTFKTGDVNHYLEFFPDYRKDKIDEVVLTSFEADELIIDYSGNLKYALKNIVSQANNINNIFSVTISNNVSTVPEDLTS